MVTIHYYLIIFISFLFSIPEYSVNVDRKNLFTGESLTLTVSALDYSGDLQISNNNFPGWKIISGPSRSSSSSISFINGKLEKNSTNTIEWVLIPTKSGKNIIPSIDIIFDDEIVSSSPIPINILEKDISENSRLKFFIETSVNNINPYLGEQITATYTLYTKLSISGIDKDEPIFKGFWAEELIDLDNDIRFKEVMKNNQRYYSAIIKKTALFPTKSGKLFIPPLVATIGVQDGTSNSFSLFGPPIKQYVVSSNQVNLDVIPLPENNINPTSIAGVGNWSINVFIDEQEFFQDEPFSIKVIISGKGNLETIDILPVDFPSSLEIFEPKITINKKDSDNFVHGNKTIDYEVIIPRESGQIKIPEIKILFFDAENKKWVIKKGNNTKIINVQKSNKYNDLNTKNFSNTNDSFIASNKIMKFIDESKPKWNMVSRKVINNIHYLLILLIIITYTIPFLVFQINNHYYRKKIDKKEAYNISIKILDSDDNIYRIINESIFSFINIKCNLNKAVYSTLEVVDILLKHNINKKDIGIVEMIIKKGNMHRFSKEKYEIEKKDILEIKRILKVANEDWQ